MASASKRTGTSQPTQLWDRGEVIGAAVLALAGIAWFGWAQDDPRHHGCRTSLPDRSSPGSSCSPSSGCWLADAQPAAHRWRTRRVRRGYWVTVAIEVVLIIGGNLLLAAVGQPGYVAPWTLFIVGIHFVPLARIFHARGLAFTGVATAIVAMAAASLGFANDLAPSAPAGGGGGLVFLSYAVWVLGCGRRPGRKDVPHPTAP